MPLLRGVLKSILLEACYLSNVKKAFIYRFRTEPVHRINL